MVGRRGRSQAGPPPDRAALMRERDELQRRLAEINRTLGARRETAVVNPPERR